MKSLKTILSIALSTAGLVTAVTLVVVANNHNQVENVTAASTTYYLCGKFASGYSNYDSLANWDNNDTSYPVVSDSDKPAVFEFKKWESNTNTGDEFKFVLNGSWDGAIGFDKLYGTAKDCFNSSGNDDTNLYCQYTGKYNVYIADGNLYIDHAEFVYVGEGYTGTDGRPTDWSFYSSKPVLADGEPVAFEFTSGETFKFRSTYTWDYATGYNELDGNDTFYNTFSSSGTNLYCRFTSSEYTVKIITINHSSYKIKIGGLNGETIYVLDKYGNALNTTHKIHVFNNTQSNTIGTAWPGADMTKVDGTNNIYSFTYWTGLSGVLFDTLTSDSDTGKSQTRDYALSTVGGKCLILEPTSSDYVYENRTYWQANTWVEFETAEFVDKYMHFADFDESVETDGTACLDSGSGYYTAAKNAYEATSFADYRSELCSLDYVVARLQAWAVANGKTFNYSGSGIGTFAANRNNQIDMTKNSNNIAIVTIVSIISLSALGAFFLLRKKRKEQ